MNAPQQYFTPDAVLTEALVRESEARAANLKSGTARNVLFGAASLAGAVLVGWAAITWAQSRNPDPAVLQKALHDTLASLPPLKVEPVTIADGGKVGIAPGGTVALTPGATVALESGSTVAVKGSLTAPSASAAPPLPDGGKRELTIFTQIPWGKGEVDTGWTYHSSADATPYDQYCYYFVGNGSRSPGVRPNGAPGTVIYLMQNGKDNPDGPQQMNGYGSFADAKGHCSWFRG